MTVPYNIAFAALAVEIGALFILMFPWFHSRKAALVKWAKRQPAFGPIKTLFMVIWFLMLVLFMDALNRTGEEETTRFRLSIH